MSLEITVAEADQTLEEFKRMTIATSGRVSNLIARIAGRGEPTESAKIVATDDVYTLVDQYGAEALAGDKCDAELQSCVRATRLACKLRKLGLDTHIKEKRRSDSSAIESYQVWANVTRGEAQKLLESV